MEFIDNLIHYFLHLNLEQFIRVFWFYFIFEFSRYGILDPLVIVYWKIKKKLLHKTIEKARRELFLENPLISIIVPGKNEGKHIYKLVTSLREQSYKNFELIVVDDGSDDHTSIIGRSLERNGMIDLFLSNEVRGGKASGANLALRYAKGKYVIHLDADCSYDYDAMENILVPFYLDPEVGAVGGNVIVRNYKQSLPTTLQAIEYFNSISAGRIVTSELGLYRIISGAFGAFRKDILMRLSGWDIGPGLDGDITVKIRKLGFKIKFEHSALCQTSAPDTFKKLANQRKRWDKSLVRFRLRKHANVFFPNKSFRIIDFVSFLENITYNLLFNFKWYIYYIDVFINYLDQAKYIIVLNIFLYTASNLYKFLIFSAFRERQNAPMSYFLVYLPLMVFYFGFFIRIVRTIAYFQETFLKASYKDPWNPRKTSLHAERMGL
jgi:cellulose synthase/poly-beta-1,6-N-acetylglucosamine synthase-like glycosyltransferase